MTLPNTTIVEYLQSFTQHMMWGHCWLRFYTRVGSHAPQSAKSVRIRTVSAFLIAEMKRSFAERVDVPG